MCLKCFTYLKCFLKCADFLKEKVMTVGMQGKIRISFYVRHKFTKLLFVPLNKNCSTVISVMIWGLLNIP